jgi:hypothetical protein
MEQEQTPTADPTVEPSEDRGDRIARRVLLGNLGIATAGALTVGRLNTKRCGASPVVRPAARSKGNSSASC